jgi:hypothetical protein
MWNPQSPAEERRRLIEDLGSELERLGTPELALLQRAASEDPDEFVREYATSAMVRAAELGRPGAVRALRAVLLKAFAPGTADSLSRARAAEVLGRCVTDLSEPEIEALSIAAAFDPDPVVREHALKGLGAAARAGRGDPLRALAAAAIGDPYVGARKAAIEGLAGAVLSGRDGALGALYEVLSRKDKSTARGRLDWYLAERALHRAMISAEPPEPKS